MLDLSSFYNAALDKTWAFVVRRSGAKIVRAEVPLPLTSEEEFTAAFLAKVTPRTRVFFISHITSPTALLFPIEHLIAEMRQRGICTIIDGTRLKV